MNARNYIGVAICMALFIGSFFISGSIAAYWNLTALLVVVSGLAAAVLLSYPFQRIANAFHVARNAYTNELATPEQIVRTLLDLAVRSKVDGLMSLERMEEKATSSFLRNGMAMLVDNYKEEEIREFLNAEMAFFNLRRQQSERVFQTMARMAPAFGVAGSVIGLIGMLMGINDTAVILQNIPVAIISTLYGLIISNLVLSPMAENIHFHTRAELLNQKLMLEGLIAISKEANCYKLERKLASFLSPSERIGNTQALRDITRRHLKKKERPMEPKGYDKDVRKPETASHDDGKRRAVANAS